MCRQSTIGKICSQSTEVARNAHLVNYAGTFFYTVSFLSSREQKIMMKYHGMKMIIKTKKAYKDNLHFAYITQPSTTVDYFHFIVKIKLCVFSKTSNFINH